MTNPVRLQLAPKAGVHADADEALPPELLAIIEALAEAQARTDYAARFAEGDR